MNSFSLIPTNADRRFQRRQYLAPPVGISYIPVFSNRFLGGGGSHAGSLQRRRGVAVCVAGWCRYQMTDAFVLCAQTPTTRTGKNAAAGGGQRSGNGGRDHDGDGDDDDGGGRGATNGGGGTARKRRGGGGGRGGRGGGW